MTIDKKYHLPIVCFLLMGIAMAVFIMAEQKIILCNKPINIDDETKYLQDKQQCWINICKGIDCWDIRIFDMHYRDYGTDCELVRDTCENSTLTKTFDCKWTGNTCICKV